MADRQVAALEAWLAPLQQACRLEAERGFGDLMGRHQTFSAFVAHSLASPPAELAQGGLAPSSLAGLVKLAEAFGRYGEAELGRRQLLVQQLRQGLHQLRVEQEQAQQQDQQQL